MRCATNSGRVAAFVIVAVMAGSAGATAQRTFVASTGSDANPCSLTLPCRSFATAISNTSANGEVIVQDSGGYGPVTITQSVAIVAPAGVYAGISVFSGEGIDIDGSGIVVTLRGLTINGQGASPKNAGVFFSQGAELYVEDCEIANMSVGIDARGSRVAVKNTVMRDNVDGFSASFSVVATLDRVQSNKNYYYGVEAGSGAHVTIHDSVLADNGTGGVHAVAFNGDRTLFFVVHSLITESPRAFSVLAGPGSVASIVSDGNAILHVSIAAFQFYGSGGTELIYSPGNNTGGYVNAVTTGGSLTPLSTF